MTQFYLVRYVLTGIGTYIYPPEVEGVEWKSVTYHASESTLVGETDQELEADGENVVALPPKKARALSKSHQASIKEVARPLPERFAIPSRPKGKAKSGSRRA